MTGRRADGYHDLVSLVAPLAFGDTLHCAPAPTVSLTCSDAELPTDDTNLVLKAARAFGAATKWAGGAEFRLEKNIPTGAGLGGGSSDAVATLRALNQLANTNLDRTALSSIASHVGSDCPLFLHEGPVVMRGRGEQVEAVPAAVSARLRGRRVLIFKPAFPVATFWAYGRMVAQPDTYVPGAEAEARLAAWMADPARPIEELLVNNMEHEVFKKFVALPTLLASLRSEFGIVGRMSGSGSACFAFLPAHITTAPVVAAIRAAWGDSAFVIESRLA